MRREIELVLVAPDPAGLEEILSYREEFAAVKIVEAPLTSVASARAAGIRSAAAPVLFIAETHSYPHPDMAEILSAAMTTPWAAVTPAIGNANPTTAISWAGFLSDYGLWAEGRPAGEIGTPPPHNAAYRRDVLLELGDRLRTRSGTWRRVTSLDARQRLPDLFRTRCQDRSVGTLPAPWIPCASGS